MKTTPISSQELQAKMQHNENLKALEALRLDIKNTTDKKKVRAKKLLDNRATQELQDAYDLFSPTDDNVVEQTTHKITHRRKTYDKKTPTPTQPTPPLPYNDKTRATTIDDNAGDNALDDNASITTSTSTSIGDGDNNNAQAHKQAHATTPTPTTLDEKVSQQITPTPNNPLMTTPTNNEKVSHTSELEKVSHTNLTITDPNGHPIPLEVILDKNKISYSRLPVWALQVMGSLSLTNLEKYVNLMGDDIPIQERIVADLLNRVVSGDKEATKIYWDLQKNLAKNPKIIQQNSISVKPNKLLENAFDTIEAEVLDAENEA